MTSKVEKVTHEKAISNVRDSIQAVLIVFGFFALALFLGFTANLV